MLQKGTEVVRRVEELGVGFAAHHGLGQALEAQQKSVPALTAQSVGDLRALEHPAHLV